MVLSLSVPLMPSATVVIESRDIPPLPVSKMKLSESGNWLSLAFIMIMPPESIRKEKLVICFAGAGTNSSCALPVMVIKTKRTSRILTRHMRKFYGFCNRGLMLSLSSDV